MTEPSVGIIGGTNGMGRWLAELLAARGCRVSVTGRKTAVTAADAARSCDVVVVAVPIAATSGVIAHVGPLLQSSQALMDLTSLKEEPVALMLSSSPAEVVGCHPLFGPDCPSLSGQNIVLCPGRGKRWLRRIERIFAKGGARVTVTTAARHDGIMALIQGLTHLDTILLGLTLRDSGVEASELDAFSTPVFRAKQAVVEKVFRKSPELYAGLLAGNPGMAEIIARYEKNLSLLKGLILNGDAKGLASLLKSD